MGNTQPWRLPEDVDLLPVHPVFYDKMRQRRITEEHIWEVIYDDPDMVATPVKRGRLKAPPGTVPVLIMGASSRGPLEIGANYDPKANTLWVFHTNELQAKYRRMYNDLRRRL